MKTMNTSRIQVWGAWLCLTLSATGCANAPYADAPQWGEAVRHAVKAQTVNPGPVAKNLPPPTTDGAAMKSSIDRYQSAFDKPPVPVNVMNIGLGSSVGSSGR